ncbi:hypothetical protein JZ751_013227 [Albula glossodonta]|uniref:Uncharacterized protein n=1 Tax=Albula glossodonta TaxID=121402 RepID=A0A8T2NWG6_9TELE|nr:hypothetical protein JZ751_013227 [Albula glossodonta]
MLRSSDAKLCTTEGGLNTGFHSIRLILSLPYADKFKRSVLGGKKGGKKNCSENTVLFCQGVGGASAKDRAELLPGSGWSFCQGVGGASAKDRAELLPGSGWSFCQGAGGASARVVGGVIEENKTPGLLYLPFRFFPDLRSSFTLHSTWPLWGHSHTKEHTDTERSCAFDNPSFNPSPSQTTLPTPHSPIHPPTQHGLLSLTGAYARCAPLTSSVEQEVFSRQAQAHVMAPPPSLLLSANSYSSEVTTPHRAERYFESSNFFVFFFLFALFLLLLCFLFLPSLSHLNLDLTEREGAERKMVLRLGPLTLGQMNCESSTEGAKSHHLLPTNL